MEVLPDEWIIQLWYCPCERIEKEITWANLNTWGNKKQTNTQTTELMKEIMSKKERKKEREGNAIINFLNIQINEKIMKDWMKDELNGWMH